MHGIWTFLVVQTACAHCSAVIQVKIQIMLTLVQCGRAPNPEIEHVNNTQPTHNRCVAMDRGALAFKLTAWSSLINSHIKRRTYMQIRTVHPFKSWGVSMRFHHRSVTTNPFNAPTLSSYKRPLTLRSVSFVVRGIHPSIRTSNVVMLPRPALGLCGTASDSAGMRGSRSPAALAAGEAADDNGEEADNGVDDGLDAGGDGVDNGHDAVSDGAEDALDLLMLLANV
jgi:hypothetical protein